MTGQTWRTDDPCPCCRAPLFVTDGPGRVTQDCRLCGWSATWYAPLGPETEA